MKRIAFILLIISLGFTGFAQDSVLVKGQLSTWLNLNPDASLPVFAGARYIPSINYLIRQKNNRQIDFEASANLFASGGFHKSDTGFADAGIKPYRIWARYSTSQIEVRLGLQKINFGSASILRPLMWFDQLDPRDPLQLTDGVWSLLMRYYFLNNSNIWLWGLYGNKGTKTWEYGATSDKFPEFGGRYQTPVPKGEFALSYHYRKASTGDLLNGVPDNRNIPEHRIGIDGKWDLGIGFWIEGSWIHKSRNTGSFTNQEMLTVGADYTFGLGNGLNVILENLLFSFDETAFQFSQSFVFTGSSLSYPLTLFDNLNAIFYYDWTNKDVYNFLNVKHQFNKFSIYLMAYWNPDNVILPQQGESSDLFAGKGIQIMLVFNH